MRKIVGTGFSKGIGKAIKERLEKDFQIIDFSRSNGVDLLEGIPEFDCDVLICNAGVWSGRVNDMIRLNYLIPVKMSEKMIDKWKKEGRAGHIVFIGSNAAYKDYGNHLYTATKAGLLKFHERVLESDLKHNIKSTLITIGTTNTNMWRYAQVDNRTKCKAIEPREIAEQVNFALKTQSCVSEVKICPMLNMNAQDVIKK